MPPIISDGITHPATSPRRRRRVIAGRCLQRARQADPRARQNHSSCGARAEIPGREAATGTRGSPERASSAVATRPSSAEIASWLRKAAASVPGSRLREGLGAGRAEIEQLRAAAGGDPHAVERERCGHRAIARGGGEFLARSSSQWRTFFHGCGVRSRASERCAGNGLVGVPMTRRRCDALATSAAGRDARHCAAPQRPARRPPRFPNPDAAHQLRVVAEQQLPVVVRSERSEHVIRPDLRHRIGRRRPAPRFARRFRAARKRIFG